MKSTAQFWNREHERGPGFEALGSDRPSSAVVKLVEYLKTHLIPLSGVLVDVGCGSGRNANYLAQQGFSVTGLDISEVAIAKAQSRARLLGIDVDYQTIDASTRWPFADESVDWVVDTVTSQLLSEQELTAYRNEVLRVLKPSFYYLLYALDRTRDVEAQRLLREHPGPEPNTYCLPDNGLVERTFTLEELTSLYRPLEVETHELVFHPSQFQGKTYERYFWWVLFQKLPTIPPSLSNDSNH